MRAAAVPCDARIRGVWVSRPTHGRYSEQLGDFERKVLHQAVLRCTALYQAALRCAARDKSALHDARVCLHMLAHAPRCLVVCSSLH